MYRQTAWRQDPDSTIAHAALAGSAMEPTAILQLHVLTTVTVIRTPSARRLCQARRLLTASVSATESHSYSYRPMQESMFQHITSLRRFWRGRFPDFVSLFSLRLHHSYARLVVTQSLSSEAAKTLVHAFVSCRLDYCNGPVSYTHLTLPTKRIV